MTADIHDLEAARARRRGWFRVRSCLAEERRAVLLLGGLLRQCQTLDEFYAVRRANQSWVRRLPRDLREQVDMIALDAWDRINEVTADHEEAAEFRWFRAIEDVREILIPAIARVIADLPTMPADEAANLATGVKIDLEALQELGKELSDEEPTTARAGGVQWPIGK